MRNSSTALGISLFFVVLALGCGRFTGTVQESPTHGAFPVTLPSITLDLEPRSAAIGQTITLSMSGWPADSPVTCYLLTAEQRRMQFAAVDKVELGQIEPVDGHAMLSFQLRDTYETASGARILISSGQDLYVFVQQGGRLRGTGPLVVR